MKKIILFLLLSIPALAQTPKPIPQSLIIGLPGSLTAINAILAQKVSVSQFNTFTLNTTNALVQKVDKVTGMGLSSNDYTPAEKTKLTGLQNFTLPAATSSSLGGVKVGPGIGVAPDGTISITITSGPASSSTVQTLRNSWPVLTLNTPTVTAVQAAVNSATATTGLHIIVTGNMTWTDQVTITNKQVWLEGKGAVVTRTNGSSIFFHNGVNANCRISGWTLINFTTGSGYPVVWSNEQAKLTDYECDHNFVTNPLGDFNAFGIVQYASGNDAGSQYSQNIDFHHNQVVGSGRMGMELTAQKAMTSSTARIVNLRVRSNYFEDLGKVNTDGHGMAVSIDGDIDQIFVDSNTVKEAKNKTIEIVNTKNVYVRWNVVRNTKGVDASGVAQSAGSSPATLTMHVHDNDVQTTGSPYQYFDLQGLSMTRNIGLNTVNTNPNASHGIHLTRVSNGVIKANNVKVAGYNALMLDNSSNNSAVGNTLSNEYSGAQYQDIWVYGSTSTGNLFTSNYLYKMPGAADANYFGDAGGLAGSSVFSNNTTIATPALPTVSSVGNYAGNALIIYDGNSLWQGTGSSHLASSSTDFAPGPFPSQTRSALISQFQSATFTSYNFGVAGQTTAQMLSDVTTQVDALFAPATYDRQIVICGEITNQLANGSGFTAQQAIDNYVTYCKGRRAKGFTVVATTVLPRTAGFTGITAANFETARTTVNNYLRANYLQFADVLADITTVQNLSYADGIHTNDAGYVAIGNYVASKVAPLLVTGFNPQSIPLLLSGALSTTGVTTPGTSYTQTSDPNVLLLLTGTGSNGSTTITDGSIYAQPVTLVGTPSISTTQAKFGGSSLYFNGSSALTVPTSTSYNFGTGDFTIEAWVYPTSVPAGYPGIVSRGDQNGVQWTYSMATSNSNKPDFFVYSAGNYVASGATYSTALSLNTWTHVAIVSSGGVRKFYHNGVLAGTATSNLSTESTNTNKGLTIGMLPSGNGTLNNGDHFTGYMHVRMNRTAVYTTNFTPPTSF